jgi:hypothetical protein
MSTMLIGLNTQSASAQTSTPPGSVQAQGETSASSKKAGCSSECQQAPAPAKAKKPVPKAPAKPKPKPKAPAKPKPKPKAKANPSRAGPCPNITALLNGKKVKTKTATLREYWVIADATADALATNGSEQAVMQAKASAQAKISACSYTVTGYDGFYQVFYNQVNKTYYLVRCDSFLVRASAQASAEAGTTGAATGNITPVLVPGAAGTPGGNCTANCGSSASAKGKVTATGGSNCSVTVEGDSSTSGNGDASTSGSGSASCTTGPPATTPPQVIAPPTIIVVTVPGPPIVATTTPATTVATTVPGVTTTVGTNPTTTVGTTVPTTLPTSGPTTTKPATTTTMPVTTTTFVPTPTCDLATTTGLLRYNVGDPIIVDVRYPEVPGNVYYTTTWSASGASPSPATFTGSPKQWIVKGNAPGAMRITAFITFKLTDSSNERRTGNCIVDIEVVGSPPPVDAVCTGGGTTIKVLYGAPIVFPKLTLTPTASISGWYRVLVGGAGIEKDLNTTVLAPTIDSNTFPGSGIYNVYPKGVGDFSKCQFIVDLGKPPTSTIPPVTP